MNKFLNQIIMSTILALALNSTSMAALQINLEVSTPDPKSDTGVATNNISIGTDPATTDSYDNTYDTVALLDGPVQAYINHSDYSAEHQKLWRDYRSTDTLPKEWTIEVHSKDSSNVNMKWNIGTTDNLIVTLTDVTNNQEINMLSAPAYSFEGTSGTPVMLLLRVAENATSINNDNNNSVSDNSGSPKGGGCGYIKDTGGNNKFPGSNSSAAINITVLFAPLIWLATRKTLKSQVLIYLRRV